jgi:hypothetical protein
MRTLEYEITELKQAYRVLGVPLHRQPLRSGNLIVAPQRGGTLISPGPILLATLKPRR